MNDQDQLPLIPTKPLKFTDKTLKLDELPPDTELVGPEPSPEMLQQTRDLKAIIEPIIVQNRNGKLLVIRGRRRVKAARACGIKTIKARILEDAEWQLGVSLDLSAHATRKDNHAAELVAIRTLMENGCSEKHIAEATGLAVATIRKRLDLTKLIAPFYEAMLKGRIAPGVCEQLAGLPEPLQQELLNIFKDKGRLTGKDVHEAKRARREAATSSLPWEQITGTGAEPTQPAAPTAESILADARALLAQADPAARRAFVASMCDVLEEVLQEGKGELHQAVETLLAAVAGEGE